MGSAMSRSSVSVPSINIRWAERLMYLLFCSFLLFFAFFRLPLFGGSSSASASSIGVVCPKFSGDRDGGSFDSPTE